MTAIHATVSGLTTRIANLGHKLYMDNFFFRLNYDLHTKAINCCGTLRPNLKIMPNDSGRKLGLKRADTKTGVKEELAPVAWKDKRNINILTNMHSHPGGGDVCDYHGNGMKSTTVQDYNRHMCAQTKSNRTTNSYCISRHTWKWTKEFFQSAYYVTMGKFEKCLHFISISTARKLITGPIIQYISPNNMQKIPLNSTRSPRLELWQLRVCALSFCNILAEKNNSMSLFCLA
jgi:hypothetical protein